MKTNWLTIVLVIASLAIGYYLNTVANERNNQKLIDAFKAELEALNQGKRLANPSERIAIDQQQQILEAQISLLEQL